MSLSQKCSLLSEVQLSMEPCLPPSGTTVIRLSTELVVLDEDTGGAMGIHFGGDGQIISFKDLFDTRHNTALKSVHSRRPFILARRYS